MPIDIRSEFFSVAGMLVAVLVLAVWLIGLSVERPKEGWKPPQRPPAEPVKLTRMLAKDCPQAIPVSDMPGYYWIGWGKPVHGLELVDVDVHRS